MPRRIDSKSESDSYNKKAHWFERGNLAQQCVSVQKLVRWALSTLGDCASKLNTLVEKGAEFKTNAASLKSVISSELERLDQAWARDIQALSILSRLLEPSYERDRDDKLTDAQIADMRVAIERFAQLASDLNRLAVAYQKQVSELRGKSP